MIVPPGEFGGPLTNGIAMDAAVAKADLDMWTFTANGGDSIQVTVTNTSGNTGFYPLIRLFNPDGTLLNSSYANTQSAVSNAAPSLGTYTVVVTSQLRGGSGAYRIRLDKYPPDGGQTLTLDVGLTNSFGASGDLAYYMVTVPPGGSLLITLNGLNSLGANELYVRRGSAPTAGAYDYRFSTAGPNQSILVSDADAGVWYIMVYGANVTGNGQYTIQANYVTGIILSTLAPNLLGNHPATLALSGAGFDDTARAFLELGGGILRTGVVSLVSSSQLLANFDFTGVSSNMYQLAIVQGTNSASLPIQIVNGGVPKLVTQLIVPGLVGRHAPSTLIVKYANIGDGPMPAPLLVVHGTENALMTLDATLGAQGLWTANKPAGFSDTIQILASGATPGILQPGETNMVFIYYSGLLQPWDFSQTSAQFTLGVFDNSNTNAVDWASLKAGLRPNSITSNAWDVVWANFVANVGSTWGDYAVMLSDNATYLGKLGLNVTDVSSLLAFELAQADALSPVSVLASATDASARQPGFNLVFGRVFPQAISQRNRLGSLGWGWSHNWNFTINKATNGVVTVTGPGGATRVFQPDVRGGFFNQAGDYGKLTDLGSGRYELRETDGTQTYFRSDGLLDYVQDLNGNRITAAYSGGLLTSLTHSSGQSLQFTYSGGLLQSVTDPFGRVTTYAYDGAQNLASATYYGTNTVSYAYNTGQGAALEHTIATVSHPGETHDYFTYDTLGRLASSSGDGGTALVNLSYDSAGTVFATDAFSNQSTFFFDQRGLLVKVENPLQNTARFSFDNNLNLTTAQGPDGSSSLLTFDALGNVTRTLDPQGNAIAATYITNANLNKLTDARGQTTGFNYDSNGNETSMVYPDGSAEVYTNDPAGEVIAVRNRRGQTITLIRDSFGRVIHEATPEGRTFDYAYDAHGNLTSVIDLLGTNLMTYDNRDLLSSLIYADGRGFTFAYDAAGRRTSRTSYDGYTLNYFYDSAGRLEHLEDGTGRQIIQYLYDTAGRLSRENKGNGTWTTYDYDAAGQVLHLLNYGTNAVPLSRFDYAYDANGNCTSMVTLEGTNSYSYDAIGQLTGVTYSNGRHVTYTYDAAGNRTAVNDNGTNTLYTVNNLNQYTQVGGTTYGYDPDGNQTNKTDASGTTGYAFDSERRLVQVVSPTDGTWQYTYDAFGNRAVVTHNGQATFYLHDPIGLVDLAAEYDNGGALVARYDNGIGVADRVDASGNASHYNFDALGNCDQLTGVGGTVQNSYDYDAFGTALSANETVSNSFRFVGRFGVVDEQTGLHCMRARYYDGSTGRFISADPLSVDGGDLNLYRYANNSPAAFIDVTGLDEISVPLLGPVSITKGVDKNGDIYRGVEAGVTAGVFVTFGDMGQLIVETPVGGFTWSVLQNRFVGLDTPIVSGSTETPETGLEFSRGLAVGPIGLTINTKNLKDDRYNYTFGFGFKAKLSYTFNQSELFREVAQNIIPPIIEATAFLSRIATVHDPNELIGPAGYGAANYLQGNGTFAYQIDFQNLSNATAPAQIVLITNTISPNLDLSTLQFTSVGFGDYFFAIPSGSQHYEQTQLVTYNGTTFDVNIEARVDSVNRQVLVSFDSVMPDTGLPPTVDVGFLPPEDGTFRGDGQVSYIINPVAGLPTGTEIRNIGTVTFDPLAGGPVFLTDLVDPTNPNSGIDTNRQALVTIDTNVPVSSVTGPSGTATNTSFVVSWSGSDVGAGVTSYDIYVQTNGGAWNEWLSFTTNTSVIFGGYPSQTYGFYSIARDGAGNVEAAPLVANVTVTTPTNGAPVIDPVGNSFLLVGQQLVLTNTAHSPNVPLTFSLVGAPAGATITTNGVFVWQPACAQGSTTNLITVMVTDSAQPPQSSTITFTVTVSLCVEVVIGSAVMQINHNQCLPINLIDGGIDKPELQFELSGQSLHKLGAQCH